MSDGRGRWVEGPLSTITEDRVAELMELEAAYDRIEDSYRLYSLEQSETPSMVRMTLAKGDLFSFLCWLKGRPFFIAKLATVFDGNRAANRPTVQPTIFVYDADHGNLLAAIEGRNFAGVRTALSSMIAVRRLRATSPRQIAIFGTGVQARAHARVFAALIPELQIVAYSRDARNRQAFYREVTREGMDDSVRIAETPVEALTGAEVVICATSCGAPTPVFDDKDAAAALAEDATIVALGGMSSAKQEIPNRVMAEATVFVDSLKEIHNYAEIVIPRSQGFEIAPLEIGQFIDNPTPLPESRRRVFKHHGLPVTDAALAELIYEKHERAIMGSQHAEPSHEEPFPG